MKPTSLRAVHGAFFLLASLALLCLLFPPVYATDFQEIPDGFRFVASLQGEDRVVTWLLWLELGGVASIAAWLGMWMYQQRAARPSPVLSPAWQAAHHHGHGRFARA